MYPPNPEAIHCITMSQIAALAANVVAETPRAGQGEMDAKPRPDPNTNNTKETAVATNAPAMMAPQDAALPRACSARGSAICSILFPVN
jgi:hypothetical protein